MKTWIAALFGVALAGNAVAYQDYSMTERLAIGQKRTSTSAMQDSQANYRNTNSGKVGDVMGVVDMRQATISSTVLYVTAAAFTQFSYVFPNNVRQVKIQAQGGTGTNFCHAGWSSSLTGSAVTAGTIEAYQHLPRIAGAALLSGVVSSQAPSTYEWKNIQTAGGFSTLFCGCTDVAPVGISRIEIEYIAQ